MVRLKYNLVLISTLKAIPLYISAQLYQFINAISAQLYQHNYTASAFNTKSYLASFKMFLYYIDIPNNTDSRRVTQLATVSSKFSVTNNITKQADQKQEFFLQLNYTDTTTSVQIQRITLGLVIFAWGNIQL